MISLHLFEKYEYIIYHYINPDEGANRSFLLINPELLIIHTHLKIMMNRERACTAFVFVYNAFYLMLTFIETSRLGFQHRPLFAEQIHERAFGRHNGCSCLERYGSIRSSCLYSEL